jgi:O-antigen ligase
MLVWSVFAVGAVYVWAAAPLTVAAALLVTLAPPNLAVSGETRMLDRLLLVSAAAAAVQLVPLPPAVLRAISPNAAGIPAAIQLLPVDPGGWRPISVAPLSTAYALALGATALVVFWTVRRCCARGMTPRIIRYVAIAGLFAALAAIVLRGSADPTRIYGLWDAQDAGARPFGSFVNRNHFATWVLMACPLAAGYVAAALASRPASSRDAAGLLVRLESLESRTTWVAVAAIVMMIALVVSASRSGVMAFALSIVGCGWIARRRLTRRTAGFGLAAALAIVAIVVAYANTQPLLARVDETLADGAGGRPRIWHETARIIRDFPVAGTGLGGYQTAMQVYQQSDRTIFINQAHNQYLHLAAEGGFLLGIPVALAVVAFVQLFRRRLALDMSSSVWLRIGGATAVLAVALQSFWETGLRIPANALLFATAAAIAVYRPATNTRVNE